MHVCIPVAICVGLCRCVVVRKVWAWRRWTFWSVASAGANRRRERTRTECYSLQVMARSSHRQEVVQVVCCSLNSKLYDYMYYCPNASHPAYVGWCMCVSACACIRHVPC